MATPVSEAISEEKLTADIKAVGDQIRETKASGAKSAVGVLVIELKALKARYQVNMLQKNAGVIYYKVPREFAPRPSLSNLASGVESSPEARIEASRIIYNDLRVCVSRR